MILFIGGVRSQPLDFNSFYVTGCVCGGRVWWVVGGFDQSCVKLMTKWDPTRTELAGLTQLVVTLGERSNDGGGG